MLSAERQRRGVTLEEVARRAGWANESIPRRLESGGGNPTVRSVRRYAEALGTEVRVSLDGMRVLSFFNHAGGTGKSSSTRDVGYVLADEGFRVLLVDTDPQANLTEWVGLDKDEIKREETIYGAVMGSAADRALPEPRRVLDGKLSIIPASLELAELEHELVGKVMGETRLRGALRREEGIPGGPFDFVLIDCPPSLGRLVALSVIASDHVVVPVQTSFKGLRGIETVFAMIEEYREAAPELSVAMVLLTQRDARMEHDRMATEVLVNELQEVAAIGGPLNYRPSPYKNATAAGVPVPLYARGREADSEVRAACDALLAALGVSVRA